MKLNIGIDWSISLVTTEYLYGETIKPIGNLNDIYLNKRQNLLNEFKKSNKIKKDKDVFIDKELQFLTEQIINFEIFLIYS